MRIERVNTCEFDLVEVTNGTPHCKRHGAMNKVTKEGIWRCIAVPGYKPVMVGNARGEVHVESICRAGCYEAKG